MNAEPPETNEPKPNGKPVSGTKWLLVALSPTLLIMLACPYSFSGGGSLALVPVVFMSNLVLSFWGSSGMLQKSEHSKGSSVIGTFFLGILFFVLNLAIGLFAGCALSAKH